MHFVDLSDRKRAILARQRISSCDNFKTACTDAISSDNSTEVAGLVDLSRRTYLYTHGVLVFGNQKDPSDVTLKGTFVATNSSYYLSSYNFITINATIYL